MKKKWICTSANYTYEREKLFIIFLNQMYNKIIKKKKEEARTYFKLFDFELHKWST